MTSYFNIDLFNNNLFDNNMYSIYNIYCIFDIYNIYYMILFSYILLNLILIITFYKIKNLLIFKGNKYLEQINKGYNIITNVYSHYCYVNHKSNNLNLLIYNFIFTTLFISPLFAFIILIYLCNFLIIKSIYNINNLIYLQIRHNFIK